MRERLRRLPWKKLVAGAVGLTVLVGAVAAGAGVWAYRRAKVSTVGELDFANALRVPPLAEPRLAADGTREFDLRFQAGQTDLVDDGPSETWGSTAPISARRCGSTPATPCG